MFNLLCLLNHFLFFQFTPTEDTPINIFEVAGDEPVDVLTLVFYPTDPTQPISVGGISVDFCSHPSKHFRDIFVMSCKK